MESSKPAEARISIIGAGPGGLTCARILQRHGIPVTVYDRDTDVHARNQGGSLDLHADDGQLALREAGLLDEFFALARPEGQEMRRFDTDGNIVFRQLPEPDDRYKPEIDRGMLRDLLLGSLEPGTVRWGRALESVDGPTGGPRQLRFSDGTTTESDLVIGADGAFSRVRPAVSSAVPRYTGVTFLEARFDDVQARHPGIADLIGHGLATGTDGERALAAQRNSGDHLRVYIVQRAPLHWISEAGLSVDDTAGLRAYLLERFAGWSPRVLGMIADNDGPYVDRPLFVLPAPHTWAHSPSVTLLGDAAHLMPPVGVGVNLAMLDAYELALALTRADTVGEAVRAYERTMLPRSAEWSTALDGVAGFLLERDDSHEGGDKMRVLKDEINGRDESESIAR
ncbi:monooxygenase [Actinoplanes sp. NBRC 14428]|uniref:Flavin-dependent monooxygenase n=1 Tax=Pseudosporangium ferrugineum TaxID=439699 RepID=A0A2T0RUB9_9ACTN|nr:NAD(P)/FAD-dependent oxidoreductase [Pseudosporangium ferrugineum]PRY24764.1 2-polyprenyl-6-methoxyphenol hydroxylase-like FAD-dependent oxidoreductase [Pseudosporangium ferrugineum]BCJ55017.1 monooxygenase [Actinoplanes sp. NBRC 14428]